MTVLATQRRTTDYSKFEMHITNRVLHDETGFKPRKDLLESMRKDGFWPQAPIICEKAEGGKMRIIDGHNRFATAMSLGIPIDYIAYDSAVTTPISFSKDQKNWKIDDYVSAYIQQDSDDYVEVNEYCERTGISRSAAFCLFDNNLPTSGNTNTPLKKGTFRIKCRDYPEKVAMLVLALTTYVDWSTTKSCITAIARCVLTDGFDHHQMIQKIHKHHELLKKQPQVDDYMRLFELIYNRQNKSEHFPLVIKSAAAVRARSKMIDKKR